MPFIGNKPSAVPLTSADIADSIITSAKIVDATITNSDVASSIITGQTAETSIAGGDSILIYDDSASALRKMTRTNFVSGIGGVNTPAFFARLKADQSVTDNTSTKAQFDTEVFDTNNNYDPSTNYRFTPTTAGKYYIFAQLSMTSFNVDSVGEARISINKNGSIYTSSIFNNYNNFLYWVCPTLSSIIDFNGTSDYVEVFGLFDYSGSGGRFWGTNNYGFFGGYKLIE